MAALCIAVTLALSGCASTSGAMAARSSQSVERSVEEGLSALNSGKPDRASVAFNDALRRDPTNSYYQLLNALAYHVMVEHEPPRLSRRLRGLSHASSADSCFR
jgi:Tfp pilus assembly protein PilF